MDEFVKQKLQEWNLELLTPVFEGMYNFRRKVMFRNVGNGPEFATGIPLQPRPHVRRINCYLNLAI